MVHRLMEEEQRVLMEEEDLAPLMGPALMALPLEALLMGPQLGGQLMGLLLLSWDRRDLNSPTITCHNTQGLKEDLKCAVRKAQWVPKVRPLPAGPPPSTPLAALPR